MDRHIIEHTTVVEQFKEHLSLDYNKRILFSAPFGAGKSTFLNDYFNNHDSENIVLKLYPVNYSVASNEDVFELIKYDLLAELIGKYNSQLKIQPEDFSPLLIAQSYVLNNLNVNPLAKALLKYFVPNGDNINEAAEAVSSIYKQFVDYKKKIAENEASVLSDYIAWCEKRKGSIHERDEITALIADFIIRIKAVDKRKTILVIDDLDRLDPEHIFRLFNIFSAHYDPVSDENKFYFDKVIFVCDFNNINLIYAHRYGENVDFKGYIDKFYSEKPFIFDNRQHLKEEIKKILASKSKVTSDKLKDESTTYKIFIDLLCQLINIKLLTLRDLDKIKKIDLPVGSISAGNYYEKRPYQIDSFHFLIIFHLLRKLFTLKQLKSYFEILKSKYIRLTFEQMRYSDFINARYLIEYSLPFILPEDSIFTGGYGNNVFANVTINSTDYKVRLSFQRNQSYAFVDLQMTNDDTFNVYDFLTTALHECEKRGFIE